MCVRDFQTISDPLPDIWRKMFDPKMPENKFLAVYLCIIEKIS